MHRFLVCVLGLLVVLISATDPLYCVDGCGRAGFAATSTAPAAVGCPFCSGVFAPVVAAFAAEINLLGSVPSARVVLPVLLLTTALERPPRA
jgi:hypothetical protein